MDYRTSSLEKEDHFEVLPTVQKQMMEVEKKVRSFGFMSSKN